MEAHRVKKQSENEIKCGLWICMFVRGRSQEWHPNTDKSMNVGYVIEGVNLEE